MQKLKDKTLSGDQSATIRGGGIIIDELVIQ